MRGDDGDAARASRTLPRKFTHARCLGGRARSAILGCLYLFYSLPVRNPDLFPVRNAIGIVLYSIYGSSRRRAGARGAKRTLQWLALSARRLRNIVGGSAGNLVEWFDWYVYAAFALYFAPSFFPKGDQTAQLLHDRGGLRGRVLMRPVGGWLMGLYADRQGRKAGLTLSVTLMCFGSLLIAVTPTYAPGRACWRRRCCWLARLMQGLSLGGEYGSSATYLSEMAGARAPRFLVELPVCDDDRRPADALGCCSCCSAVLERRRARGLGLAHPVRGRRACSRSWLFSPAPARRDPELSNAAATADRAGRASRNLFRDHPREASLVMALTAGGTLAFYAYTIYMQKFLANTSGLRPTRRRRGS